VKVIKGLQPPFVLISVKIIVLQLLLLGVKFAFSLIVSFFFVFRFDCYEGCIVCVIFAYASLVFIHTKKIISKDKHCDCVDHHPYANNKDILMID
jgi:hypothetical protein